MSRAATNLMARYRRLPPRVDLGDTTHIKLSGLSRTATPADLRRLCARAGIDNVASVSIDYHKFTPSQAAYISFTHPSFVQNALKSLRNTAIGGYPITAEPSPSPDSSRPHRFRGMKGRAEAAGRGVITGDGPGAGISRPGTNVLIYGLPPNATVQSLKRLLRDFTLADPTTTGEPEIVRIEPEAKASRLPKFLVRLGSASDAQRLVREVHLARISQEKWAENHIPKVRII